MVQCPALPGTLDQQLRRLFDVDFRLGAASGAAPSPEIVEVRNVSIDGVADQHQKGNGRGGRLRSGGVVIVVVAVRSIGIGSSSTGMQLEYVSGMLDERSSGTSVQDVRWLSDISLLLLLLLACCYCCCWCATAKSFVSSRGFPLGPCAVPVSLAGFLSATVLRKWRVVFVFVFVLCLLDDVAVAVWRTIRAMGQYRVQCRGSGLAAAPEIGLAANTGLLLLLLLLLCGGNCCHGIR